MAKHSKMSETRAFRAVVGAALAGGLLLGAPAAIASADPVKINDIKIKPPRVTTVHLGPVTVKPPKVTTVHLGPVKIKPVRVTTIKVKIPGGV